MEIVHLEPTTIARVRMPSSANTVARDIRSALDQIWEVIRSGHAVVAGHNVAVYHDLSDVVVEIYGDWSEDESELRTDLFDMLRPD